MKRFVEVSYQSGGRMITKLYPARSVGRAQRPRADNSKVDDTACQCGFLVCSPPSPCAPEPVTPPPADVLPDGWTGGPIAWLGVCRYEHMWGAVVSQTEDDLEDGRGWQWYTTVRQGRATTRELAMASALSALSEVSLPDGWSEDVSGYRVVKFDHPSGACVWRARISEDPELHAWGWAWASTQKGFCNKEDHKPTRDEAMVAALSSVFSITVDSLAQFTDAEMAELEKPSKFVAGAGEL